MSVKLHFLGLLLLGGAASLVAREEPLALPERDGACGALHARPSRQDPQPVPGDPFLAHTRIYKQVAPCVVYIQGRPASVEGTGVLIRDDGLILTSLTACGRFTEAVQVLLPGHKRVEAQVIGREDDKDLVLLKIDARGLPAIPLADSRKARLGQISYAFGDSFHSIREDDQVAMSVGVISGMYEIDRPYDRLSRYAGLVLETSAAVNPHQDGGPLVDSQGRLLGLLTLNYHDAKFTGLAIPVHILKPDIDRLLADYEGGVARGDSKSEATRKVPPRIRRGWLGVAVEEAGGVGLRIRRVHRGSPAEKAGLKTNDVILAVDTLKVPTPKHLQERVEGTAPGTEMRLRIWRDGREEERTVRVGKRPEF
ncbi:MAG: serine protease [Planctomycetes bacterium]|nr:serine protease [Planctomycetota bacterium]